jgi:hypothetical protein
MDLREFDPFAGLKEVEALTESRMLEGLSECVRPLGVRPAFEWSGTVCGEPRIRTASAASSPRWQASEGFRVPGRIGAVPASAMCGRHHRTTGGHSMKRFLIVGVALVAVVVIVVLATTVGGGGGGGSVGY